MEAVIEYIILGIVALAFAFVSTPFLLDFYIQAVNASNDTALDQSTQDIISVVLLLTLSMFYFFLVYVMYGSVKKAV